LGQTRRDCGEAVKCGASAGEMVMIACWGGWKAYPRPGRSDNIEAPIAPGIYEVRCAQSGELFAFGAVDNLAEALSRLPIAPRSLISILARRRPTELPDLEYRVCATASRNDAKTAAERMIGRRETWMRGAA
jgi:hypothetical protein